MIQVLTRILEKILEALCALLTLPILNKEMWSTFSFGLWILMLEKEKHQEPIPENYISI